MRRLNETKSLSSSNTHRHYFYHIYYGFMHALCNVTIKAWQYDVSLHNLSSICCCHYIFWVLKKDMCTIVNTPSCFSFLSIPNILSQREKLKTKEKYTSFNVNILIMRHMFVKHLFSSDTS